MAAVLIFGLAAAPEAVERGLGEFQEGRFAEALRDWRQAADAGDARGALYIGVLFDTGLGVDQDFASALAWYKRAAEAGSAVGAFNAGVLYDSGLLGERDPKEAARWYARAAAAGFGRAAYNLGILYQSGLGVTRNRAKAIQLFKQAAAHGVTAANSHLAALGVTFSGGGTSAPDVSMQAFQQAQGMVASRSPAEAAQATAVFRDAAKRHDALADYDLGYCYERGLGVPLDDHAALFWYGRAAADTKDAGLRSVAQKAIDFLHRQSERANRR